MERDLTARLLGEAGILPRFVAAILQLVSDIAASAPLQTLLEDVLWLAGVG